MALKSIDNRTSFMAPKSVYMTSFACSIRGVRRIIDLLFVSKRGKKREQQQQSAEFVKI
jgi:hypothetical protein